MEESKIHINNIIGTLEALSKEEISLDESLLKICETLHRILASSCAIQNTHNYAQIAYWIVREMYAQESTDSAQKNETIVFTEVNDLPKDLEHAVFRACAVLLLRIESKYRGSEISKAAIKLDQYIEEMGHFAEFYSE
jgi:sugar-specific transcriptional regulator TrmB